MVDPSLDQNSDLKQASAKQRLIEARWFIIALAVVFIFFAITWDESGRILTGAFIFLIAVIAFSPRKQNRVFTPLVSQNKSRPIWPETQAKLFVNAIPEPSIVLDGEGIVRHTNAPMREVFGSITQGDLLTLKFRDPDIVDALTEVQNTGAPVSINHMVRFPTERHYLIYFSPITLPRAAERRRGVTHLSDNPHPDFIFLVMLEQTESRRVDALRSDFIANVSHELRTPVASLTGFIETLLGPARDDEESRERFLKIMLEQAQRMTRLVNDLLSLSRIEMRSHVRPTDKIDLAVIVSHVIDAMAPIAEEASLAIKLDQDKGPLWVTGDSDELTQVLQNLVENACKYGADGQSIEITTRAGDPPADAARLMGPCYILSVQDHGKGIPGKHLPRLTERFYRVDAEESKRKMGTGLGLAVVKHILMRHSAELRIKSVPNEGALFSIYMTRREPDA